MLSSAVSIDVVFVLTADQYHAEHVIACADAGKHVMIEKPMAQTEAEADAIEAARQRNGVVIFVGYMRRYATALLRMKEVLAGKEIKYVRVRDIIGRVSGATGVESAGRTVDVRSVLRSIERLLHGSGRDAPQVLHRHPLLVPVRPNRPHRCQPQGESARCYQ
jgi:hypothetical protein